MSYSIYVNDHNSKTTVHDSECHYIRQNQGKGKGYWVDSFDSYSDAWEYIGAHVDDDYERCDCSSCL